MFESDLLDAAQRLLAECRSRGLMIVTAESCTGGLIAGLLTEIPGSSDVVDRGFVTYSNAAKSASLGVPPDLIRDNGSVSAPVAIAMAEGAIRASVAGVAIAVTGVAGPGGGTATKPVGLVHLAVARRDGSTVHHEARFGDVGRSRVRIETVRTAIGLLSEAVVRPA